MPPADHLDRARTALRQGDARQAFLHLKPALVYPGPIDDPFTWVPTMALFAEVTLGLGSAEMADRIRAVADASNVQALYDLGYALIDQGLPEVAATFLHQARRLRRDEPQILSELVAALERSGQHEAACFHLRDAPELLVGSFVLRYQLGFNGMASGDVDEAERQLATLGSPTDDTQRHVSTVLHGMVARARALLAARPGSLDARDLRGWHMVMTGSVLLHLSPYGRDEGMNGRYAFVQDSEELCREGLEKLARVLGWMRIEVPRVLYFDERASLVLAHALAARLGVSLERWADAPDAPGLVVVYDPAVLEEAQARALLPHRPGQHLFAHAACWTEPFPIAPDVTTFLHQLNRSPWGPRLVVDREGGGVRESDPVAGPPEALAARLLATDLPAGASDERDLADLEAVVAAVAGLSDADAPGLRRGSGLRHRHYMDSPVKSAAFV